MINNIELLILKYGFLYFSCSSLKSYGGFQRKGFNHDIGIKPPFFLSFGKTVGKRSESCIFVDSSNYPFLSRFLSFKERRKVQLKKTNKQN